MTMPLRLDDNVQTLVLIPTEGLPAVAYWGMPLPQSEDLSALAAAAAMDLTGGMLDRLAPLTICPLGDGVFQGQPGLTVSRADGGGFVPRFGAAEMVQDGPSVTITARDASQGLTYTARIWLSGGLVHAQARIEADQPIRTYWLAAPVMPIAASHSEIIEFSGKWLGELHLTRQPLTPGARLREARSGRSGQEVPPFAYLVQPGTRHTGGGAVAFAYGWPGGHRMICEELPCGRRQMQFGHAAGSELAPSQRFETAVLTMARSDHGLNGCAVPLQRYVRDQLVPWPDRKRSRPVHYNCWEAVYFNHDLSVLSDMAERAASLGAERFVLDDGWFGRRDNDTSSLGDWTIDRRKWPDGLTPLIDKVHSLGMTFGLWVEPEMVNPNSDLYRAHPDWALGLPDQVPGRNQFALDIARQDVQDYLFACLDEVLKTHQIDYLKWDHNRLLPVLDAAQGRAILTLMARLRAAHPGVEIESCASGGGRIDYGILQQTCRVWLSDCIDAQERLRMQAAAALILPTSVVGSHIGAAHAHTTGREMPSAFRGWIAASRHMGFESDLRVIPEPEAKALSQATTWYKANRDWMMAGDLHLLDSDDPAVTAEIQISASGDRFVVFAGQGAMSQQILPRPLRLTALDPLARYEVALINPADAPPQSRGPAALKTGPVVLTGRALMSMGLNLPVAWPNTMYVLQGRRLQD